VVGIPFFDSYVEKAGIEFLEKAAKDPDKPFFININFMKVHQPNMPAPEFEHKSLSKSKYADSVVELDTRIGRIMDKLRQLGLDKNTLVFYTTDNGAWQDVNRGTVEFFQGVVTSGEDFIKRMTDTVKTSSENNVN
jgi:arylsulfatase